VKIIKLEVGDVIRMKKPHPCGAEEFDVLRVGSDLRIRCRGCGHDVTVARLKIEKNIREVNNERITQ